MSLPTPSTERLRASNEVLYTGIDDQDLTVPEIIRVLVEEK